MKNSSLAVIFFLLSGLLVTCSKDELTSADRLVGTWNSGTAHTNVKVGDMTLIQYFVSTGISSAEAVLYTALVNSTVQTYFSGDLQINGDKTFTWKSSASSTTTTGTWSVDSDGTELTLNSQAGLGGVFEITDLTGTELELHSFQNFDPALIGYTLPSAVTIDMTLSFSKD